MEYKHSIKKFNGNEVPPASPTNFKVQEIATPLNQNFTLWPQYGYCDYYNHYQYLYCASTNYPRFLDNGSCALPKNMCSQGFVPFIGFENSNKKSKKEFFKISVDKKFFTEKYA